MATHRNAVNPPPLPGVSPGASSILPPAFGEEPDTQNDLPLIDVEESRPTDRTPVPPPAPSPSPGASEIRTILSPPPAPGEFEGEDWSPGGCVPPGSVASSGPLLYDQQVRLARKS